MSIEQTFDNKSEALITPEIVYGAHEKIADICIATFSHAVHDKVIKNYKVSKVAHSGTANGRIPIYMLEDCNVLFYMSPVGSSSAGCIIDEVRCLTGASKFIFFGSCGILDEEKCGGKIIVPTSAYRDEGFSYHYAPAQDYIEIKKSSDLASVFDKLNVDYIAGKTWTTDAIYRETINNRNARKNEGCVCVEMECSGLQAVCDFRKIDFYPFLFGGDLLNDSAWNRATLGTDIEKENQFSCFELALKVAEVMANEYHFFGWQTANIAPIAGALDGNKDLAAKIKNPSDLYDALSKIWSAQTCAPRMRGDWTPDNKTLGQCSITAFLAQDIFGGKVYGILRDGGNYHCYNVIGDCVFDLTSEQFGDEKLCYTDNPEQFRDVHFAKEEKRLRYEFLKAELLKLLAQK